MTDADRARELLATCSVVRNNREPQKKTYRQSDREQVAIIAAALAAARREGFAEGVEKAAETADTWSRMYVTTEDHKFNGYYTIEEFAIKIAAAIRSLPPETKAPNG